MAPDRVADLPAEVPPAGETVPWSVIAGKGHWRGAVVAVAVVWAEAQVQDEVEQESR